MAALSAMNGTIRIPYCWRWWIRLVALAFAVFWTWMVWREPGDGVGVWIARVFGVLVFLVAVVSGETVLDPARGQVRRAWKLFGVLPLLIRTFPIDAFREVRWRRIWMEGEIDSEHRVELVPKTGRAVILTTFISHERNRSCADANALALQVSECLGLPFTREPDAV